MEEVKVKRGGARPGAGRKNRGHKAFNIRCTEEEKIIMIKALNDYRAIHGGLSYKPQSTEILVADEILKEQ